MLFLSYLAVFFLGNIALACVLIIFKFYQNWDAGVYPDLPPRKKTDEKTEPETPDTTIIG